MKLLDVVRDPQSKTPSLVRHLVPAWFSGHVQKATKRRAFFCFVFCCFCMFHLIFFSSEFFCISRPLRFSSTSTTRTSSNSTRPSRTTTLGTTSLRFSRQLFRPLLTQLTMARKRYLKTTGNGKRKNCAP